MFLPVISFEPCATATAIELLPGHVDPGGGPHPGERDGASSALAWPAIRRIRSRHQRLGRDGILVGAVAQASYRPARRGPARFSSSGLQRSRNEIAAGSSDRTATFSGCCSTDRYSEHRSPGSRRAAPGMRSRPGSGTGNVGSAHGRSWIILGYPHSSAVNPTTPARPRPPPARPSSPRQSAG